MDTKTILTGLGGLIIGGLIVSVAATSNMFGMMGFNGNYGPMSGRDYTSGDMTMQQMASSLRNKTGDDFDRAFLADMTAHHEGAVAMAKLAATNAKHDEVKKLSRDIIAAQEREIDMMSKWQKDWGYGTNTSSHDGMMMEH